MPSRANACPAVALPERRARVERAIERLLRAADVLIGLLDQIDAPAEDLEEMHDREDDRADEEPWLGAPERHPCPGPARSAAPVKDGQLIWALGSAEDYEAEG